MTSARFRISLSLVSILLLTGCAGTPKLIPTPAIYETPRIGLFSGLAPLRQRDRIDILYATDRLPAMLQGEALLAKVREVADEVGYQGPQDKGKFMKVWMGRHRDLAEGRVRGYSVSGTFLDFETGQPLEGAVAWHMPTTENPALDSTEVWEIYNATGDAHPVHLHLVNFEVGTGDVAIYGATRQEFTADVVDHHRSFEHVVDRSITRDVLLAVR